MSDNYSSDDDARDLLPRFKLVYLAVGLVGAMMFTRLWILQIVQGQELREYSEKNRIKENRIPAPRGLLLDREGRILVDNTMGFDATISPQYATRLEDTAKAIGTVLDIDAQKIVDSVKLSRKRNGPFMPVAIKENLSLDEVVRLKVLRFDHPGLEVQETVLRYYPLEQDGAQLFGYVGEISKRQMDSFNKKNTNKYIFQQGDIVGQSGLEEIWDYKIRGKDGLDFIEVDAHGRNSPQDNTQFLELKPQKELPGQNFVLTIDKDIQEAAFHAMMEQKDAIGPRIGAAIAMTSQGEILAWVVTPTFNPNKFAKGIAADIWSELVNDPFKPLINKPIQDHYSPGSTIKPIIAVAALQEGVITPNTIISAPGMMMFGGRPYHDTLKQGHGNITVSQAIERSSNIFFYKMGIGLGIDNMSKYAALLGLGQKTGIKLANETAGIFPSKEWKMKVTGEPWQPGENLSNAIGQGFVRTTLLQMMLAYNTIATGKLVRPILVKKILSPEQKVMEQFEPEVIRDVTVPNEQGTKLDKKNLEAVRYGMWRVANGERGTAHWYKVPGVEYAGKTGTTQLRSFNATEIYDKCEGRPFNQRHHGSFIGYAPADKPEIAVAVFAQHTCHGATGAAPIARDIILAYFQKHHPEIIKAASKSGVRIIVAPTVAPADE